MRMCLWCPLLLVAAGTATAQADKVPTEKEALAELKELEPAATLTWRRIDKRKEVVAVEFNGGLRMADGHLECLRALPRLEGLTIQGQDLSGPRLQVLAKLTGLRSLRLCFTDLKPGALRSLRGLKKLEQLDLIGSGDLGQEDMADLAAALPRLRSLRLAETVGDAGVFSLSKLKELETLELLGTHVTDRGLAHLRKLPLKRLCLSSYELTDAGMAHVAEVKSLEQLHVYWASVTDDGLASLRGLTRLKALTLSESLVTGKGLRLLRPHLTRLESLNLTRTKVTGEGLDGLADWPLRELFLGRCKLTDDSLKHVAACKKLRRLDLSNTRVGDAGVAHLAKCKELEELDLIGTRVTDNAVGSVASLPALRALRLDQTAVTDGCLGALARMPALKTIGLTWTKVSRNGLRDFAAKNPKIDLGAARRKLDDD